VSDENGEGEHANSTGAFVGMAANDTSGQAMHADFSYFSYSFWYLSGMELVTRVLRANS